MLSLATDQPGMFWGIFGAIAIVAILSSALTRIVRTRSREGSRREIAAYIAEGSMTPEQGERLMRARPHAEKD